MNTDPFSSGPLRMALTASLVRLRDALAARDSAQACVERVACLDTDDAATQETFTTAMKGQVADFDTALRVEVGFALALLNDDWPQAASARAVIDTIDEKVQARLRRLEGFVDGLS